ncbi:oxidoreductase C-terminal domain-containing protein [Bradyrhizobium sp. 14AA]
MVRGDAETSFSTFCYRDGTFIGVESANRPQSLTQKAVMVRQGALSAA